MSALVDRLARLAAEADAPPLDDLAAHRMVERALVGAVLSRPEPRRISRWLFAVPALAAVILAYLALRPAEPDLLRITLPTGDKLVGTHGAQFDIAELAPASRRFSLHAGTMLFDVAHAVPDQRFEVTTPHAVIVARGTVFSVTTGRTTRVHVYEGVVEVSRTRLSAGESWSSDGASRTAETAGIVEAARDAVRTRAELAAATRVEPSTAPPAPIIPSAPRTSPPTPTIPGEPSRAPRTSPPTPRTSPPTPTVPTEPSLDLLLTRARSHISLGRFTEALDVIQDAKARGATGGAWHLVEGDALRGLGKPSDAADAFEAAARVLVGNASIEAAYTAAYLRFHDLRDGPGALAALDLADVDREGSSLEERGLALRVRVLDLLGRRSEVIAAATRYLDRFPKGGMRAFMTAMVRRGSGTGSPSAK